MPAAGRGITLSELGLPQVEAVEVARGLGEELGIKWRPISWNEDDLLWIEEKSRKYMVV